ncbi:MAG: hypothetical protein ACM3JG_15845 [Thiohalocapsa sp.]
MPMLRSASFRAAAAAAALIALSVAPAVAQPWVLSRSPDAIRMRWYGDTTSEAQARGLAGAYCGASGRAARLATIEQDGSAVVASYRCF